MTTHNRRSGATRFNTFGVVCALMMIGMLGWTADRAGAADPVGAVAKEPNECVICHSNSKFMVRNPKLYDYYQNWRLSIHGQEDVSCVACHGGDPKARDAKSAHRGAALAASEKQSPINFRNIPITCAKCHKAIYAEYRESLHFQNLVGEGGEPQGPNCVTCHGSVNTTVLQVSNVRATCEKCHNEETDNSPEIPGQAEMVLSKMLSISRYYHYITLRGEPEDVRSFFRIVDPLKKKLATVWHSFDIDAVTKESVDLLKIMKLKRRTIKLAHQRSKETKNSSDSPQKR